MALQTLNLKISSGLRPSLSAPQSKRVSYSPVAYVELLSFILIVIEDAQCFNSILEPSSEIRIALLSPIHEYCAHLKIVGFSYQTQILQKSVPEHRTPPQIFFECAPLHAFHTNVDAFRRNVMHAFLIHTNVDAFRRNVMHAFHTNVDAFRRNLKLMRAHSLVTMVTSVAILYAKWRHVNSVHAAIRGMHICLTPS